MISFIITYHNEPLTMLRQCLDSVLSLSLSKDEREIILLDDGSSHSPINELYDMLDHIIYVRQKNGGLSNARNTGMKLASGQYVQFIDADDYLLRAPYEHCLDIMRYQEPDMVMFCQTQSKPKELPTKYEGPIDGAQYMRHNNLHAAAWGYLFKKQLAGSLHFREGIYHEDEEFTPQLLLRTERLFVTNAHAYFYRKREGSITHKRDTKSIAKRLNDLENVILHLKKMAATGPTTNRDALQRRVAQLSMDYLYKVIVETRSVSHLEKCVERLRRNGLFPLPDKPYTQKYQWFRRLTNFKAGRRILCRVLPRLVS